MIHHVEINSLKGIAIVLITIAMPFFVFTSCSGEKNEIVDITFDPQTSYTLKETNVKTLVPDSGIIRYKIIADTFLVFGKASEPYWYFPDGIYLEKFDSTFNVEASLKADTAHYFQRRNLWRLDGNVDISNTDGVRFETSQLFWDQNKKIFYSDSFIKITEGEELNTGIGFTANQNLSEYSIFHSTANFTVEMRPAAGEGDSIPAEPPLHLDKILPDRKE
ncbi:MAG: LPS export ABC transporter periplasmic protein LptC [Tannerella sp.]|jgi:LPS export ABC transporter protein LptC|nr:LPS export ABC transporter periplasmic protein LptC [Tannerella sp.]